MSAANCTALIARGLKSAPERRERYLGVARELRKRASQAHALETRRDLMKLAVLYEELAEYAVNRPGRAQDSDT